MNGIPNDPKEFLERVNKISPEFEITGNYTKLSETYLHCKCKKCGHKRNYSAKTLLETQHCRYCERMKKYDEILNISDEEFKKRVKLQYPYLNITGTYKPGQKEITCICEKCGCKNRIKTLSLLNGSYKCLICENGKENIQIGVNDIKSINPVLYDCLIDKSINEKFTINSRNKTDFVCPSCGQILKNKTISHVNTRGLKCKCQDGNSLGEKYLYQVLKSVDSNIEAEKYINNNHSYRYDFYSKYNGIEWICELNGKQHYEKSFHTLGGRTLEEEIKNDKEKQKYALEQGINRYIVINSKESGFNQLKDAIINSDLSKIYDFSNVNWVECYRQSLMSDVFKIADLWKDGYKVMQICDITGFAKNTVRIFLTRANDIGYCKYDHTQSTRKYVKCIETGEIFKSLRDAERTYNIKRGYLSGWLKGRHTLPVANYTWEYYQEESIA